MYDLQWFKFSVLPKEGQRIFIRDSPHTFADTEAGVRSTTFSQKMLDYNPLFYGEVWCDAEPVLNAPEGFDPRLAGKMCLCGHPYHRHFDSYEEWAPVGCKYCHFSVPGVSHRKEINPPEGFDFDNNTWNWQENASICEGFKEDPDAEPEECEWAERLVNAEVRKAV